MRPERPISSLLLFGLATGCVSPPSLVEAPTVSGSARQARAEPPEASAGGSSGTGVDASSGPTASRAAPDEAPSEELDSDGDFDAGILAAFAGIAGPLTPSPDGGVLFGSGTIGTGWGSGSGVGGLGLSGHGSGGLGSSDAGAVAPSASLSAEQIRRVVVAHRGSLRACYELEAQKDTSLAGKVVLSWRVDPTGSVSSARVSSTTMNNSHVEGCLVRQVRSWRFPPSSAGAAATFPFVFGTH